MTKIDQLIVTLKRGDKDVFSTQDYTDYEWRPEAFIVLRGDQWVAMYNWDTVANVRYYEFEVEDDD